MYQFSDIRKISSHLTPNQAINVLKSIYCFFFLSKRVNDLIISLSPKSLFYSFGSDCYFSSNWLIDLCSKLMPMKSSDVSFVLLLCQNFERKVRSSRKARVKIIDASLTSNNSCTLFSFSFQYKCDICFLETLII